MNTILVVDDNNDYRVSLLEILEFENYATFEAENGLIGLHIIREYSPHLILCDVEMPIMNGIELLKIVKADPICAKIPFIIASNRSDDVTMKMAYDLGAAAYLTKTVIITELLATIGSFLNAEASALPSV